MVACNYLKSNHQLLSAVPNDLTRCKSHNAIWEVQPGYEEKFLY